MSYDDVANDPESNLYIFIFIFKLYLLNLIKDPFPGTLYN